MPRTRTPVARGSRVPAWPTLRVPQSRRARPTTSWLVQPAGLSTTSRPSGAGIPHGVRAGNVGEGVRLVHAVRAVLVLVVSVRVRVTGVRGGRRGRGDGGVALLGLAEQVLEVRGGLGDRVGDELERRRQADLD